jgi:hypothetical protein
VGNIRPGGPFLIQYQYNPYNPPQTFPAKIQQSFDVETVTYSRRVSVRGIGLASVLQKEKKILATNSQTALKESDTSVLPISALNHYLSTQHNLPPITKQSVSTP